jgi:hypothetical protein
MGPGVSSEDSRRSTGRPSQRAETKFDRSEILNACSPVSPDQTNSFWLVGPGLIRRGQKSLRVRCSIAQLRVVYNKRLSNVCFVSLRTEKF